MTRTARQYVLLHPDDCDPPHALDLTAEHTRDAVKVAWLEEQFARDGFDPKMPALVGYPLNGRVQLLSGTHRHEAARRASIRLPVRMVLRSDVEATWGTARWTETIRDVPVIELEDAEVHQGARPPDPDERVTADDLAWRAPR